MAFHFSSSSPSSLQSHNFLFLLHPSIASPLSFLNGSLKSAAWTSPKRKSFGLTCRSSINDDEDYLLDAPVSIGDGFSFSGGKYSDGPNPADEWVSRGKIAYSYRKVLPVLSKDYHAIGFDWLGFGFSDKPQPGYGFDYTLAEYVSSLESFLNELGTNKVSLVAQGYFSPVVVKYASSHQDKLNNLILLNPPTYVEEMRKILMDKNWGVPTTICWGQRDRWLTYDGVEDFCEISKHRLIELPMNALEQDKREEREGRKKRTTVLTQRPQP
ncbi:hypothetical protein TEA_006017 [Camellia sinensis var. sinensis]|uniref:AB hydrolase-1 domain-containing protein n=1 Tax=Camellia sinensis var. sinensis TaxID=542762 RepID=A0A4S4DZB8_CAMSN|nr:hypothetical protein TEA_006017 [Camellia sinensis var. sinensis]